MAEAPVQRMIERPGEVRRERLNRIRIGATGLAVIVLIVLLAVSFSGTASNEPELTPEAMAEQAEEEAAGARGESEAPEDPLAELGVAPPTAPVEETPPGGNAAGAPPRPANRPAESPNR